MVAVAELNAAENTRPAVASGVMDLLVTDRGDMVAG